MISHEPPHGAVAPLPVWPTIRDVYGLIVANAAALARIAALPFLLALLVSAVAVIAYHASQDITLYRLIIHFGTQLPWALMAVA